MKEKERYNKMIKILTSKKFQDNFIKYCKKKKNKNESKRS